MRVVDTGTARDVVRRDREKKSYDGAVAIRRWWVTGWLGCFFDKEDTLRGDEERVVLRRIRQRTNKRDQRAGAERESFVVVVAVRTALVRAAVRTGGSAVRAMTAGGSASSTQWRNCSVRQLHGGVRRPNQIIPSSSSSSSSSSPLYADEYVDSSLADPRREVVCRWMSGEPQQRSRPKCGGGDGVRVRSRGWGLDGAPEKRRNGEPRSSGDADRGQGANGAMSWAASTKTAKSDTDRVEAVMRVIVE